MFGIADQVREMDPSPFNQAIFSTIDPFRNSGPWPLSSQSFHVPIMYSTIIIEQRLDVPKGRSFNYNLEGAPSPSRALIAIWRVKPLSVVNLGALFGLCTKSAVAQLF